MSNLQKLTGVLHNLRTVKFIETTIRESKLFTKNTSEMKPVTETWKKGLGKAKINWFVDTEPEKNI